MSDYARSLLQELMSPYEKSKKKHFDAEDVRIQKADMKVLII
jgi:hypothetical protein